MGIVATVMANENSVLADPTAKPTARRANDSLLVLHAATEMACSGPSEELVFKVDEAIRALVYMI